VTLAGWDDSAELDQWLAVHAVKVAEVPASWSVTTASIHLLAR
jgi:hypothetical protein